MDIPAIDKAVFLIDRKDLDTQTTMAFQAYANSDLVDVDAGHEKGAGTVFWKFPVVRFHRNAQIRRESISADGGSAEDNRGTVRKKAA